MRRVDGNGSRVGSSVDGGGCVVKKACASVGYEIADEGLHARCW